MPFQIKAQRGKGTERVCARGLRVCTLHPYSGGGPRPGRGGVRGEGGERTRGRGAGLEVFDAHFPERAHDLGAVARAEGGLHFQR
jgi:hypothetical protein